MIQRLVAIIDAFWSLVAAVVLGATQIIDRGNLLRKSLVWSTLALTLYSFWWSKNFAETSSRADAGVAMIIAAVLASVSGLQGYVFSAYLKSKNREGKRHVGTDPVGTVS
jgi:hypothetical protein